MSEIKIEESWVRSTSAANQDLERIARRGRTLTLPPGLDDGEAVRAWILGFAPQQHSMDVTEKEREETASWEAGVTSASASSLWDLYLSYYPHRLKKPVVNLG
ncbi:hypothetical protein [Arthrobacter glacialis]|nr:hypothetical protein [Arthrobacter glacialis]